MMPVMPRNRFIQSFGQPDHRPIAQPQPAPYRYTHAGCHRSGAAKDWADIPSRPSAEGRQQLQQVRRLPRPDVEHAAYGRLRFMHRRAAATG